ncbi:MULTISPECIES: thioesterase family protein [Halomonadaceae]|uniref:Thioesterase family protein n=1 Tax=Modicisalibacter zincidurans TaxID=1178777 RepID=A0ABP9RCX9_9GAMM|nr:MULTISPECIES: thioesterase family protein [Halomonas]MCD6007783.1 thioesterase family protein [Halomonas sp. IOP_31]
MSEANPGPVAQRILATTVAAGWVDYNGHMNDAAYALVFSQAVDALMAAIDLDAAGRARHAYTLYTLEIHLSYRREAHRDQPLTVEVILLDRDAKRLHAFFSMRDEAGECLATSEQMLMGIATDSGRPGPFPEPVTAHIAALPHCVSGAWPALAGRRIAIPRREAST